MMRAWILLVAYVGTVVVANVLTSNLGLIDVWPTAFLVPAGTYAAGLALGLRDELQDSAQIWFVWAGIAIGSVLSFVLGDGQIAFASGVAFLVSEIADFGVYTPLRGRGRWVAAVLVSNLVGAVIDTMVFLPLSGLEWNTASVAGQILVKAGYCSVAYLLVRWVVGRRDLPRHPQYSESA